MVPPSGGSDAWELVIPDSTPPHMTQTSGTGVADVDGDGKTEVIIAGSGSLVWYRPSSSEKGVIALGEFGVGVALKDINGDGRKEVIVGKLGEGKKWLICWYQSGANLLDPWTEHVLDGEPVGHPHDVVFGDLDGNGKQELVANAMYCDHPGLFAYRIPADPRVPWKKQLIQTGRSAEGTATGDGDGDGREEIVCGP